MAEETPSRINVSRDALRADLAEMELRLYKKIDDAMRLKADAAPVAELALKVDQLDRGDFTPVHRRALSEFIDEHVGSQAAMRWTDRGRVMAVCSLAVAMASLMVSAVLAIHGVFG